MMPLHVPMVVFAVVLVSLTSIVLVMGTGVVLPVAVRY